MKNRIPVREHIRFIINFTSRLFTAFILILAIATGLIHGEEMLALTPVRIFKIFVFASSLAIITMIIASLEHKKWMLKLSFLQKRWIFMPVYLGVTLLFIYNYFISEYIHLEGVCEEFVYQVLLRSISIFLVTAVIMTTIFNIRYKNTKKEYTGFVNEYKQRMGEKEDE